MLVEIFTLTSSHTPLRVFECYLVPRCPFGVNGLLGDEAVASAFHVLVDPVHLALLDAGLFVVMVGDQAAVLPTVRHKSRKKCELKK